MKRNIKRDIRWNEYEIEMIDEARKEQDFSEFVRTAALDKALHENGNIEK